jgi:uncharacterized metal-binding protein
MVVAMRDFKRDSKRDSKLALVYSCSGCSSVAQLANVCAVRLDREARAEMSCISGVGGGVPSLLKLAQSGRPILALDGCALSCVSACLNNAGVTEFHHLVLNREGAKKRFHSDPSAEEESRVWQVVLDELDRMRPAAADQQSGAISLTISSGASSYGSSDSSSDSPSVPLLEKQL